MAWNSLSDPSRIGSGISRLSAEQAQRIHGASLEILERIGVQLHLPEAIHILKRAGAGVTDDNRVRVPHKLVESALASAPREVTLHNRFGEAVMRLGGERCFFGPGSDCLNIIDHRTGIRRKPVMQDVIDGVTICDALTQIDFVMSMLLPADIDQTLADIHQMEAMLSHTTKPIIYVSYGEQGLVNAVEMAEVVAGGEQALRQKPILTCYINVVSGAVHNAEGLKKLIFLSGKGLPSLYIPSSTAGVTSPVTMAGAVALDNAGVLLGLVLSQLNREGAPFISSAMEPGILDMRTLVSPYSYPERGLIRSVARCQGLPALALAGGSDSKVVDQQAAAEAALNLLADVLMGGNIIHDLGYLESGLTYSFSQLVLCDQMVSWIKAFTSEIEVNDETLALDEIEAVGPGGNYLATRHTKKHFREIWYPELFERGSYADWVQKGSKPLAERAAERVQKILAKHHPQPLPVEVKSRLREIVTRAEGKSNL